MIGIVMPAFRYTYITTVSYVGRSESLMFVAQSVDEVNYGSN
jgi:hypothetical protein